MAYLIAAGVGLAVGVSVLVFALRERSARHSAEATRDNTKRLLNDSRSAVARLQVEINFIRQARNSSQAQIKVLRNTIYGLHEQLAECTDPAAVEKLLNDELGEQL